MTASSFQSATPRNLAPPFAVAICFPDVDVAVLVAESLGDRAAPEQVPHHAAWPDFLRRVLSPLPPRRVALR